MTTVILVGLIVVLLAAATYVGVLLVRRSRSAPAEAEPDGRHRAPAHGGGPAQAAGPADRQPADDPAAELSGDELFVPRVPRQDGVAVPAVPGAAEPEAPAAAAPSRQPATPADGLEIGDAPWRRAARMAGAEPGGTWETAPIPRRSPPRCDGAPTPDSPPSARVRRARRRRPS